MENEPDLVEKSSFGSYIVLRNTEGIFVKLPSDTLRDCIK
jgi:hypothetical protein